MGAIGTLIPLVLLFAVVGALAFVGYQVYLYTNELAARGVHKMEKKNVVFTKDGMRVGVKEVRDEDYADRTRSTFVRAWDYAKEDQAAKNSGSKSRQTIKRTVTK